MYTPNQIIEQYLQQIKIAIYRLADADDFIDGLRQQLYDYAEGHTPLSTSDLIDAFGAPEEVAADFLETLPAIHPKKVAKTKKWSWVKTVIILILAVIAIGEILHLNDIKKHKQVMATDVITIYEPVEGGTDDET